MKKILTALVVAVSTFNAYALKDHNVVIHVDSRGLKTQKLAMNAADNLQHLYGKDKVNVEIVTCGPGLNMVKADTKYYTKRIKRMIKDGIRYSAGIDYTDKQELKGQYIEFLPGIVEVQGCLMRIVNLQEQGYTYMKP